MADTKISALTDGTSPQSGDRIPIARSPYGTGDNRYLDAMLFTPAGSDTQVQFNNAGAFGASAKLTWVDASTQLVVGEPGIATGSIQGATGTVGNPGGTGITIRGGDGYNDGANGNSQGADFEGQAGNSIGANDGGNFAFSAGGAVDGGGGVGEIGGGLSLNARGGDFYIYGGPGGTDGGDLYIDGGAPGSGARGNIIMSSLPTSDPGIPGALWINGTVLEVSP